LRELSKDSRGGAQDGPVHENSATKNLSASPTRERASQRGEYENFLVPQTPSAYPLATQQGVSGGDENANTYYVPTAQLTLAQTRGVEGQAPG
jgi:hypothetical protein